MVLLFNNWNGFGVNNVGISKIMLEKMGVIFSNA